MSRQAGRACRLLVRGLVQGIGFRPAIWRLAADLELRGWIRNCRQGVEIHLEGEENLFETFLARLPAAAPRLARIERIDRFPAAWTGESAFRIAPTQSTQSAQSTQPAIPPALAIPPDLGICPECLDELFDPQSRRYRYPLLACTHCGPRYGVIRRLPYERDATTLAPYPLCPDCAAEYRDPADRRFHAEATACPRCGPPHRLLDADGRLLAEDPAHGAWRRIQAGRIVAVKGLGGFHLVCDARNADAVARLRQRKNRDAKPFAIMAANLASLRPWVEMDEEASRLLASEARPIVLLPLRADASPGLWSHMWSHTWSHIAPGLARLGVMLPATPMQWLLLHEAAGRPEGMEWTRRAQPFCLVMTSANPGGEPLVTGNEEALARLSGIADAFWLHDREIAAPCDDSLLSPGLPTPHPTHHPDLHPIFIRRARGHAPAAIVLADDASNAPSVLALGAYLKNAICLTRGREAFLSPHIGSLDNAATLRFLEQSVERLCSLLAVTPAIIAHDLHPDFPSTHLAHTLSERLGVPALAIAHHHAHIAAVAAEHRVAGPLLGLALDGIGLGPDGGLWGGELLRVAGTDCRRLGHLAPLALPGGDAAAREPWRIAAAFLYHRGTYDARRIAAWLERRFPGKSALLPPLLALLEKDFRCPRTSSLGRLFDAAAALLGVCDISRYEAEAAMRLESLAWRAHSMGNQENPASLEIRQTDGELDFSPLLLALAEESDAIRGAARFHGKVAAALAEWAIHAARREGIEQVALAGGCLQNTLLARDLSARLTRAGLSPLLPRAAPPGDGGLALGQAWIARRQETGDRMNQKEPTEMTCQTQQPN